MKPWISSKNCNFSYQKMSRTKKLQKNFKKTAETKNHGKKTKKINEKPKKLEKKQKKISNFRETKR